MTNYYITRMVRVEVSKEEFDQHGRECDRHEQRRREHLLGVKSEWFMKGATVGVLLSLLIQIIMRVPS